MSEKTFETAIKEIEQIVTSLEKGDMPLDEMLTAFEKGIALSKTCTKMLDSAEKRINVLTAKSDSEQADEF